MRANRNRPIDIIDGGYLSWFHGASKGGDWGGWSTWKFRYSAHLIAMDDAALWRKQIYPDYKARRALRAKEDPIYLAKKIRVQEFREILDADPFMLTARLKGMEADDLMAVAYLLHPRGRVISVDKDLFQIPGMKNAMWKIHEEENVYERSLVHPRFPAYTGSPTCGLDYCLIQSLLGDKSDSIPRLLPSHAGEAKRLFLEIQNDPIPLWRAYHEFGRPFLLNLQVILIPGPPLLKYSEQLLGNPAYLFHQITTGAYWSVESLRPEVKKWVEKTIRMASRMTLPRRYSQSSK